MMKKVVFSSLFLAFIALGTYTVKAVVSESVVSTELSYDDDDDKKKKSKKKKDCCATEEKKACCDKKEGEKKSCESKK